MGSKETKNKEDYANNPRFDCFCPRIESELKSFRCDAGLGRLHDAATTPASNRTGVATELGFHTFYAGVVPNSCKRVVKKQKIPHRCQIEPERYRHRVNGA